MTAVWELTSSVLVVATAAQARSYFNIVNTWQTRYCLKSGMTIGNAHYTSVRRVQPPAVADQQAEVRARKTLLSNPTKKLGAVVLFIQRGAVNIELYFEWSHTPIPTTLINSLAKKIAARAG